MDTFDSVAARRSIHKFDPAHVMQEEDITRLLEAAILSPTSFNIQNWRFVAVTDATVKAEIRRAGWNQPQFSECSLLLIICGDRDAYRQDPARYCASAPPTARERIVKSILAVYGSSEGLRRDENLRSGGIAAQTVMLVAKAMGYDTCPMIGFDPVEVARIIRLPADHDIVVAVAVGKALEPARARGGQLPLSDVVRRDRF